MKALITFCLLVLPAAATAETIQGRWKLIMAETCGQTALSRGIPGAGTRWAPSS